MIPSTHLSLLDALKDTGQRKTAWERFQKRYQDTLYRWCVQRGLQPADAENVTQTVLLRLYQSLPRHQHDAAHSFRGWLKTVVSNAIRDVYREAYRHPDYRAVGGSVFQEVLANLGDPGELDELDEAIHGAVDPDFEEAVTAVKARVAEATWRAFWRQVVDGVPAAEVAEELGLSVASAYQARYRVSQLLSQQYQGGS